MCTFVSNEMPLFDTTYHVCRQLSQQSLEKAHENERQAMERYNEGEISIVEVIEAQTYRQNAEINHVQAKASAQGQYSALIKALNQYK